MPKSNIFGVVSTDNVFYVQPYFDDKYEIGFGQNIFGKAPTNGNVVLIEYRTTVGSEANGITSMAPSGTISGYQATVILNTTSSGGSDIESIESIKYFAPKSIQIQDRAITKSDYEILLKNKFPEIQAALAYGGEEKNPPHTAQTTYLTLRKHLDILILQRQLITVIPAYYQMTHRFKQYWQSIRH